MITEDYVSFETAKLLKEKGFKGYSIITIYDENAANAYIKELKEKHLPYCSDDPKLKEFYYTRPTLQMAMKWLLKKHNIFICPLFLEESNGFGYTIEDIIKKKYIATSKNSSYKEPEEACETAIKYSLENLI